MSYCPKKERVWRLCECVARGSLREGKEINQTLAAVFTPL